MTKDIEMECSHCELFDIENSLCEDKNLPTTPEGYCANWEKRKTKKIYNPKNIEVMNKYIFDPNEVLKIKTFSFCKFNDECAGFGLLLPKRKEIYDKKGKLIDDEQIVSPAIINSNNEIEEINRDFERKYKIKFEAIPSENRLRWTLPSIEKFLKKEYAKTDGLKLFNKIKRQYQKYLYANEIWYSIHALWDMGSYFFLLFKAYPIFELRGLKRTAKTKWMTISSSISFNASEIMINPSESSLFRETHDKRYSKYIDEAEKLFRIEKGKIIADQRIELINASYYYKGTVPRVEKFGNKFITIYYHLYSPTMVASIKGLFGATEDRSIIHITTRNPEADKRGEIESSEDDPIWEEIRDELYIFVLQNWRKIESIYTNSKNDTSLKDRDFQIWKPLLSIAKFLDNKIYDEIKEFSQKLSTIKKIDSISEGTLDYNILKITHDLIESGNEIILIKDILKNYPSENKPHNKTISSCMDRLGFLEYKEHTREGNGYRLNGELFENIVIPILPTIFSSSSSLSSHTDDNRVKVSEEDVKEMKEIKKDCEGNEGNEGNEAKSEMKGTKK